ncbi:hypothetical protein BC834DRAFT_951654, partial [Gloeopeniophorella convolvens]
MELPTASSSSTQNPLFDQALRKHLDALQPEDRDAFTRCTAEDVLAAAEQLSSTHATQSRTRRYLTRFTAIVRPLEGYFDAVDHVVCSMPSAQLGGVVWGALKFVLSAIHRLSDFFEEIVKVLEEIAQSLPFYRDYAVEIYRDSERVQQALADVYSDILVVCSAVRRVFLKKGGSPRSGSGVLVQAFNPWNKAIEDVTKGLQNRRELLERELKHADRMLDHGDRLDRQRRDADRLREQQKQDFLALLPYEDCYAKHEDCLAALQPDYDAGNWLLNREEFTTWADHQPAGLLWVHGKPGVGKTVLASITIEWAKKALIHGKRPTVAFFYCEHDNPKKRDPQLLLATLLHQVLRQLPPKFWADLEVDDGLSTTRSLEKLCNLLKAACDHLEETRPVVLVVDALDECEVALRKRLLPLLVSLGRRSRLLLTSRKEMDLGNAFENTPYIAITAIDVDSDIHHYVGRKVKLVDDEEFPDDSLGVGDPTLLDEISRTLIERAEGMFLWVQLQISHLQEQRTDHDIREALTTLSSGLQPTFIRILKSIDRLPATRRVRVQRILRWVVCAEHPLGLRELSEAVAIQDMQDNWDTSRCVNRPTSLIEDCFNLVLCTESSWQSRDSKVQLIHSSVKEFLLQNPLLLGESLAAYHIYPLPDAYIAMVTDCFKYLGLVAQDANHNTYSYPVFDPMPEERHPLVMYTSEFWPQHLRAAGPAGEQLVHPFSQFLQPHSLSRHFWSERYNRKRDNGIYATMSLCHLAARLSLPYIVKPILAQGIDGGEGHFSNGLSALHLAARFAEDATLRVLVESGADINVRTHKQLTALHIAAGNWDGERVVQALLDLGANATVVDKDGRTPLHVAAQNGYGQGSLLLLLEHGADVHRPDNAGQLPIHAAAANPYGTTSIQYLLAYGAD